QLCRRLQHGCPKPTATGRRAKLWKAVDVLLPNAERWQKRTKKPDVRSLQRTAKIMTNFQPEGRCSSFLYLDFIFQLKKSTATVWRKLCKAKTRNTAFTAL